MPFPPHLLPLPAALEGCLLHTPTLHRMKSPAVNDCLTQQTPRYRASGEAGPGVSPGLSLAPWLMLQAPLATCFVFSTAVLHTSQHSKAPYLLRCLAEPLSWKTKSGRGLAGFLALLSQKDPAGPRRPAQPNSPRSRGGG